ncbi:hypothetical protein [Amycolatopsis benzoatilytica]|uniref:hypothetical protein n=1 Tax=Amycolatopsis benzoatilytica TaxID=346045 RepID=UPI000399BDCD|nr:hypothetical protein [Amycolatopsis benzoatilytica]
MSARSRRAATPDSHDFPTRPYDLVREFTIALVVVTVLAVALAAVFSSPDEKPITMADWANNAPADVVATAAGELAGTTTSAGYGAPYNTAGSGQQVGPFAPQHWAGVTIPVDPANDLVLTPLNRIRSDAALTAALSQWNSASATAQSAWSNAYVTALAAAPDGSPAAVKPGDYGPVPVLSAKFLDLARSGGLEGSLDSSGTFYGGDATRGLLLLADGAYLEDRANASNLGGRQWGMMNEVGNYPGQPWMWLYTFWYQIPPFSSSPNADAQVWLIMLVLTLALILLPFIPGLRSIPRLVPLHRLIWRDYYRAAAHPAPLEPARPDRS